MVMVKVVVELGADVMVNIVCEEGCISAHDDSGGGMVQVVGMVKLLVRQW